MNPQDQASQDDALQGQNPSMNSGGQVPGASLGDSPLQEVSQPQTPVVAPVETPVVPTEGLATPEGRETPAVGTLSEAPAGDNPPAGGAAAPSADSGQAPAETEIPTGDTSGQ